MRKIITILLVLLALSASAVTLDRGFDNTRSTHYALSLQTEYMYNRTHGSIGNFAAIATMPLNPHFELRAGIQASTINHHTLALQMRPKFDLPIGQLFIDGNMLYKAAIPYNQWDLVGALSVGYRMDFLSFQVGSFARIMDFYKRDGHSASAYNVEPFNLMYRVQVFCRPQTEQWNLWFAIANFDEWQYERMWQPMFFAGAHYDFNEHWQLNLAAQCKLAGMFHLDATFYAAYLRAGFTYRF